MKDIAITGHASNWTFGHIGDFDFEVKHFSEPSRFGIESGGEPGRISKLRIERHSTYSVVAAYDRGWDKLPHTDGEIEITQAIINRFN